jgi:hypothetical protein
MDRDDISIANSYEKSKGNATEEQLLDSVRQNLKYRRESEKGSDSYEMINGWLARDLNELDLRFPGHKYSDKFLDLPGRGKNAAANKQLKEEIKKTQELAKELANETEKVIKDKIVAEKATQDELKKSIAEVKSTKKGPTASKAIKSTTTKKSSVKPTSVPKSKQLAIYTCKVCGGQIKTNRTVSQLARKTSQEDNICSKCINAGYKWVKLNKGWCAQSKEDQENIAMRKLNKEIFEELTRKYKNCVDVSSDFLNNINPDRGEFVILVHV